MQPLRQQHRIPRSHVFPKMSQTPTLGPDTQTPPVFPQFEPLYRRGARPSYFIVLRLRKKPSRERHIKILQRAGKTLAVHIGFALNSTLIS